MHRMVHLFDTERSPSKCVRFHDSFVADADCDPRKVRRLQGRDTLNFFDAGEPQHPGPALLIYGYKQILHESVSVSAMTLDFPKWRP